MAQRLVRRRCQDGGAPLAVEGAISDMIENEFKDLPAEFRKTLPQAKTVYGIAPTPTCANGTQGRIAVFEMVPTSPDLERVILKNPIEEELYKVARKNGLITMKEDAIIKMMQGIVPFEEVNTLGSAFEDPDTETAAPTPTPEAEAVES
jgi:type II secretory ATPase GspE/PulE/Tfp pilus assembly ATPase PilB-like protein